MKKQTQGAKNVMLLKAVSLYVERRRNTAECTMCGESLAGGASPPRGAPSSCPYWWGQSAQQTIYTI